MRIFVTGVNGQLGHDVLLELQKRGHEAIGSGSGSAYTAEDSGRSCRYVQLNITDAAAVETAITALRPDAVVHCSAWTAVDAAEDEENRPTVYALNVTGTENLAKAAGSVGAKLLYLSTDYVFNGKGTQPREADSVDYAPLNYYGETKLLGEEAVRRHCPRHYIVRTAWVFGKNGKNFIKTMIGVGKTHEKVTVVNDQIGTPTYTRDLADLLCDMAEREAYGTYHATNEGGYISWYDLCVEAYRQYGLSTEVVPVTTAAYGLSKAARPENSRLDKSKLTAKGFKPLPDWKDAVRRYLEEAQL